MEKNKLVSAHGIQPDKEASSSMSHAPHPEEEPTHTGDVLSESETTALVSEDDEQQVLSSLLNEITGLHQDFETKIKYDASKDRLIESLHQELQFYRGGLHLRILRPLFLDLIALHDELSTSIAKTYTAAPIAANQSVGKLTMIQTMIEEILSRNGVESFTTDQEVFLPDQQRIVRVIATDDQQRDKHIARRVKKGFTYEGNILRPELVETYRWRGRQQHPLDSHLTK